MSSPPSRKPPAGPSPADHGRLMKKWLGAPAGASIAGIWADRQEPFAAAYQGS